MRKPVLVLVLLLAAGVNTGCGGGTAGRQREQTGSDWRLVH
jgi:hypothetical protein